MMMSNMLVLVVNQNKLIIFGGFIQLLDFLTRTHSEISEMTWGPLIMTVKSKYYRVNLCFI